MKTCSRSNKILVRDLIGCCTWGISASGLIPKRSTVERVITTAPGTFRSGWPVGDRCRVELYSSRGTTRTLRGLMRRTVPRCFRGSSIYATDARWNCKVQSVKVSVWVGLVGVMVRPTTDAIRRHFEATPGATTLTTRWSGLQQVRGWTLC
jgi:hypothetical protein